MRKHFLLLAILLLPIAALAHVGSPDVYYEGDAGPYHLLVTVRPPAVIPGVAEIQIRSASADVNQIEILPLRILGPGAKLAPTPDLARRSSSDPRMFHGNLWIMARGSWKVQIKVDGPKGKAELAVPMAAVSTSSARMQKTLGGILSVLGLLLVAGIIGIIAAANREADLAPGVELPEMKRRRGARAAKIATRVVVTALLLGGLWWRAEARDDAKLSYKLPQLQLTLRDNDALHLTLQNPNDTSYRQFRSELQDPDQLRLDDLVTDHGHLMHLFLVRMPDMKSFWHLHPQPLDPVSPDFHANLPSLPAGHYKVFSDIVHQTGFPETQVGEIDLPATRDAALAGDDSGMANLQADDKVAQLSNGYRMVWVRDSSPLKSRQAIEFRFRIEDKNGNPAGDLENYMGMAGHAVFIRDDGQVFAHVHPSGSMPMASAELAQGKQPGQSMAGMEHQPASAEVTFPYGFPQAGAYHIFVQIKRAGKVETGAFVAHVL